MGEAKRKRAATAGVDHLDLARVALALRKTFNAASPDPGADCCLYASFGQYLLQRLGVTAEIALGYAAWRVGDAAGDTIVHHPVVGWSYDPEKMPYHAWLEVGGRILDFTTHDLKRKSAMLDAQDGGRTNVQWHPDFLLVEKRRVASSVEQVGPARHAGVFYYERVPSLEARYLAEAKPVDKAEMGMLWLIYQNPDMVVIGPNG